MAEQLKVHKGKNIFLGLSAGADSWFLLFLLKNLDIPFTPLSLNFEKRVYCEWDKIQHYSKHSNTSIKSTYVSKNQMVMAFYAFTNALKIPIYNLHPVSKWILAERAQIMGADLVITGDGADQWFEAVEQCDLFPITQAAFNFHNVPLVTPFATKQLWQYPQGKQIVREYVISHLGEFDSSKTVVLYPDDDFYPLTCLQKSHLVLHEMATSP
ncbi:hypothetical protein KKF84_18345 [Myxococcota bacterium]|nr:hypothetical protein [Myxococcota bacterium]